MIDVAYIALGSNMGDRHHYLAQARTALASLPGCQVIAESSIEETEPLGEIPQGPYLNQMVALETELSPRELLAELHRIEREAGRTRDVRWGPRTLDLDIVRYDTQTSSDIDLVVPHPAEGARDFWVRELSELRDLLGRASTSTLGLVSVELPSWAQVSDKRRAHILRVAALLERWANVMCISEQERRNWIDAARWHDSLRDAPREELRRLAGEAPYEPEMLHGPAAAAKLVLEGERRSNVLDAIRYHTVGSPAWDSTGKALYMADFLEPGRSFSREDRAFLSAQVPHDFEGVFRQVVRMRLVYALNEGHTLFPETVQLWNSIR